MSTFLSAQPPFLVSKLGEMPTRIVDCVGWYGKKTSPHRKLVLRTVYRNSYSYMDKIEAAKNLEASIFPRTTPEVFCMPEFV